VHLLLDRSLVYIYRVLVLGCNMFAHGERIVILTLRCTFLTLFPTAIFVKGSWQGPVMSVVTLISASSQILEGVCYDLVCKLLWSLLGLSQLRNPTLT
jgi:hypothetical protein